MPEILDTVTFATLSIESVYGMFLSSADDAGVPREDATCIFAEALAGDVCWRELIEDICGVEFL